MYVIRFLLHMFLRHNESLHFRAIAPTLLSLLQTKNLSELDSVLLQEFESVPSVTLNLFCSFFLKYPRSMTLSNTKNENTKIRNNSTAIIAVSIIVAMLFSLLALELSHTRYSSIWVNFIPRWLIVAFFKFSQVADDTVLDCAYVCQALTSKRTSD